MGRGVSSGGGQSSLGYLFAGPEDPKPSAAAAPAAAAPAPAAAQIPVQVEANVPAAAAAAANKTSSPPPANAKQTPAGIVQGAQANNYYRADGQNTGNFITDRPSTKVHAAPGGGSSLGYLFGGGGGSN
ncbi:hypothetical protein MKW94_005568 [Papaver nudicaule]|uniref:Protein SPIRAL1-like 1 n=1 Tax=Papaver nudicaule TaxID=74823 RepID=A0AA41UX09_PAPNU|nr:hypothetical protein [Papaver nudicaule]MCL7047567.1 hypothetical protein [Papaver nudicaule]